MIVHFISTYARIIKLKIGRTKRCGRRVVAYLCVTSLLWMLYVAMVTVMTELTGETVPDEWARELPFLTVTRLHQLEAAIQSTSVSGSRMRRAIENDVVINPAYFRYNSLGHENICARRKFSLFIYVHSAAFNGNRRAALRETWVNRESLSSLNVGFLFFVGQVVDNAELRRSIGEEIRLYNDIVLTEYVDVYSNISLKAASVLTWVARYCAPYVPYLLKVDDDMYVDLERFMEYINDHVIPSQSHATNKRQMYCELRERDLVHREAEHVWTVSKRYYSKDIYPTFCPGLAYMMTSEAARALHVRLPGSRVFPLDDVWLTAIVAQGSGVEYIPINYMFAEDAKLAVEMSHVHLNFIFAHCSIENLRLFWRLLKSSSYQHSYNLRKAHTYVLL